MILTLVACGCFAIAGWNVHAIFSRLRRKRKRRQLLEINRLANNLVLPSVDDPRWESQPGPCHKGWECRRQNMVIGKICCCMDHGVVVSDMGLEQTWPEEEDQLLYYAQEVRRRVLDRMVQESIDAADHPRLEEGAP